MRLKALIFDVDGTLADTEMDGHRVAFNRAFKERGLSWHWSRQRYLQLLAVTGGKERIRHFLQTQPELPPLERNLPIEAIADIHRLKTVHFRSIVESGEIPLLPGVARLLRQAQTAGIELALATTTQPENVEALIRASMGCSVGELFGVVAAGDCVANKKPDPAVYNYALERLGLTGAEVVAIEDSAIGLAAAKGAGLTTLVVNGRAQEGDFPEADLVLKGLGDPLVPAGLVRGPAVLESDILTLTALDRLLQFSGE